MTMPLSLIGLPCELLRRIKDWLPTLSSHVSFAQTCRATRSLYQLEEDEKNDFMHILRRMGMGRPSVNAERKEGPLPTWIQLANAVAKHSAGCKFNMCCRIGNTDITALTKEHIKVVSIASPLTERNNLSASALIGKVCGTSYRKHADLTFYNFGSEAESDAAADMDDDLLPCINHVTAYCCFASNKPIATLQLFEDGGRKMPVALNESGITILDVIDSLVQGMGRPLNLREQREMWPARHYSRLELQRVAYYEMLDHVFFEGFNDIDPDLSAVFLMGS